METTLQKTLGPPKESHPYFVEKINYEYDEVGNQTNMASLLLFKGYEDLKQIPNENEIDSVAEYKISTEEIKNGKITEGQYILLRGTTITKANNTRIARKNILYNNSLRGLLIKYRQKSSEEINFLENQIDVNKEIYSYHINVGHGNCSLLVIKDNDRVEIWMIDCSKIDISSWQNMWPQLQFCFDRIMLDFNLENFFINKFFLTHYHYDHFSGIKTLIERNYISANTEFFLNLYYPMPYLYQNDLFRSLLAARITVIEPLSNVHRDNIQIWHPHVRTVRSDLQVFHNELNYMVVNNPNNSSAVYVFTFGEKSIVFPGDLERDGWNRINNCIPHLQNCNYYTISHHGSINGHLRNCPAENNTNSNLGQCVLNDSIKILMGRNGAFRGIYAQQVLNDFNHNLYLTENAPNFLKINWQEDMVTMH